MDEGGFGGADFEFEVHVEEEFFGLSLGLDVVVEVVLVFDLVHAVAVDVGGLGRRKKKGFVF